jgi:hypothetical protein
MINIIKMNSFIINKGLQFLKNFSKQKKIVLGRWHLEYCDKKLDKKVFLTNEDHCGTCSKYTK